MSTIYSEQAFMRYGHNDEAQVAFIEGANFALSYQWESVEDALPEIDWKIHTCRDIYLCRDSYWVALCIWDNGRFIETSDGEVFMATHWMPIPPLPEARQEEEV